MDNIHLAKPQKLKFTLKLFLQVAFPLILLTIIPLQLAKTIIYKNSPKEDIISPSSSFINDVSNAKQAPNTPLKHGPLPRITSPKCDIFTGEWVPNPDAPYYTNTSCWAIHEHQNCMKYGRPDSEFMKWKWKPDGCDLPVFNPSQFFEIVRGKSLAFVGDSVARNQMQSLICLLSRTQANVYNYGHASEMLQNMPDAVSMAHVRMLQEMQAMSLQSLQNTRQGHLIQAHEFEQPRHSSYEPPRYNFRNLEQRQQEVQEAPESSSRPKKKSKLARLFGRR